MLKQVAVYERDASSVRQFRQTGDNRTRDLPQADGGRGSRTDRYPSRRARDSEGRLTRLQPLGRVAHNLPSNSSNKPHEGASAQVYVLLASHSLSQVLFQGDPMSSSDSTISQRQLVGTRGAGLAEALSENADPFWQQLRRLVRMDSSLMRRIESAGIELWHVATRNPPNA
jgi:hypothetical protein